MKHFTCQKILRCELQLEKQAHTDKQQFLNSINKVALLARKHQHRRLMLITMVDLVRARC